MPKTNLFSTVLRDGEGLDKIQAWVGQFYRDELVRFEVVRAEGDMVRLLIECRSDQRLQLVSSSPADGAYLATGVNVPTVDLLFSQPIQRLSLTDQITINGVTVPFGNLSFLNSDYRVRISTAGLGTFTAAGTYSVLLGSGVKDVSGLISIADKRTVSWNTSSQAASTGGQQTKEKIQDRLAIARFSIDNRQVESEMLREFLLHKKIEPTSVVSLRYLRHAGFHARTMIFVIYAGGTEVPEVVSTSPAQGATLIMDSVAGAPAPMNLVVHFNTPVPDTPVPATPTPTIPTFTLDDVGVDPSNVTFSSDRRVATVSCTLTSFGHHQLVVNNLTSRDYTRPYPFLLSFTVLESFADGIGAIDELTIWEDVLIQDDGLRFYGNDPIFPGSSSIWAIGSNPGDLHVIPDARVDVRFFADAQPGQNPVVAISGWSATHGIMKTINLGVDAQGVGVVDFPHAAKFVTSFGDSLILREDGVNRFGTVTALPVATIDHVGGFVFRKGIGDNTTRLYVGIVRP